MPRYIDADALIEHMKKDPLFSLVERYGVTGVIEAFPTADAVEANHGKWTLGKNMHGYPTVPYYREVLYCSECRSEAYWDSEDGQQEFDWCPHCGAKMNRKGVEQ